jgi:hypothetical protein
MWLVNHNVHISTYVVSQFVYSHLPLRNGLIECIGKLQNVQNYHKFIYAHVYSEKNILFVFLQLSGKC